MAFAGAGQCLRVRNYTAKAGIDFDEKKERGEERQFSCGVLIGVSDPCNLGVKAMARMLWFCTLNDLKDANLLNTSKYPTWDDCTLSTLETLHPKPRCVAGSRAPFCACLLLQFP